MNRKITTNLRCDVEIPFCLERVLRVDKTLLSIESVLLLLNFPIIKIVEID